ncbi:glycosyltransferase family 39 protein [Phenylobacterium sp.]|uniref:ArnT family glycosyltransferase n=1 Tax=Phenylobacterium sp. TaxID=1871053 RepID=UPI00272FD4E1|nr:phospholipid carrier-dependent glycosyltransferase [Phenylobacterium sp.]MDP2215321.1 phospholipid carrier-dependent glycosyltransferase [Phenylobacterium sp.]
MTFQSSLQWASQGWRGPLFAALLAMVAGLPGVFAMPPLDRDESRFAQATAQMLETGDFVVIRYQDEPRFKKPVGIHWLQAASVSAVSAVEDREIWAYRLPSLLGAMLAAAACAWGAAAFFSAPGGLIAGALLGSSLLLSTEAFIAKTDAVLCGSVVLAMAALGRIYGAARGGPPAGWRTRLLFWLGLSLALLVKGPVGLMVALLTIIALVAWERRADWLGGLGLTWGPILLVGLVGPWAWAVTVATDGAFWSTALMSDLAPKLAGGHETHGAPPGYHLLGLSLLAFPMTLLIPAGLIAAWTRRHEPGVRFALCWLIPTWIVFELAPTKLVHYTLPVYGALAWLAAAALQAPLGRIARWTGAGLGALAGLILAGLCFALLSNFGAAADVTAAAAAGGLLAAAGLLGAFMLVNRAPRGAIVTAMALSMLGHGALSAGLAPGLAPLWSSARVARILESERLLPRQGMAPSPVAVAGYAEPSLVFALGTPTKLGAPADAAQAIATFRPAVVEAASEADFRQALDDRGLRVRMVRQVTGLNYSNGRPVVLRIYVNDAPRPQAPAAPEAPP